jgi:hypothetical protein
MTVALAIFSIDVPAASKMAAIVKHSEPQHTAADQEQRFRLGSWRNGGWSGFVHVVTGGGQRYCTILGGEKDLRHPYRRRCSRKAINREIVFLIEPFT